MNNKEVSIKYYKLYLQGLSAEEVNDEVVGNVVHNVWMLYGRKQEEVEDAMERFKQCEDKRKELQMFMEWIAK